MNDILYLKIPCHTKLQCSEVRLGDVASMECSNEAVKNRLKTLKLWKIREQTGERYICSVLKVVELIHSIYPGLEIQNLGETDFIVEYQPQGKQERWVWVKVALVCVILFFGSVFSIMTFNNDVGVTQVFGQVYSLVMGQESDGFTALELSYSLGLAIGVLVFYNHFGGRRITRDPTPMEVQIRSYEQDVNTTLIETGSREGTTIDVD